MLVLLQCSWQSHSDCIVVLKKDERTLVPNLVVKRAEGFQNDSKAFKSPLSLLNVPLVTLVVEKNKKGSPFLSRQPSYYCFSFHTPFSQCFSPFIAASKLCLSPKELIAFLFLGLIKEGSIITVWGCQVQIPFTSPSPDCSVLVSDTTLPFWDFPCILLPKPAAGHPLDFSYCSHQICDKMQLKGGQVYFDL